MPLKLNETHYHCELPPAGLDQFVAPLMIVGAGLIASGSRFDSDPQWVQEIRGARRRQRAEEKLPWGTQGPRRGCGLCALHRGPIDGHVRLDRSEDARALNRAGQPREARHSGMEKMIACDERQSLDDFMRLPRAHENTAGKRSGDIKDKDFNAKCEFMVRSEGLEPPRCYSLPPQGSASTSSATSAKDEQAGIGTDPHQRRRFNKSEMGGQGLPVASFLPVQARDCCLSTLKRHGIELNHHRALHFLLRMISAKTRSCVSREKPLHRFSGSCFIGYLSFSAAFA